MSGFHGRFPTGIVERTLGACVKMGLILACVSGLCSRENRVVLGSSQPIDELAILQLASSGLGTYLPTYLGGSIYLIISQTRSK